MVVSLILLGECTIMRVGTCGIFAARYKRPYKVFMGHILYVTSRALATVSEQLAISYYVVVYWQRFEPATSRSPIQCLVHWPLPHSNTHILGHVSK